MNFVIFGTWIYKNSDAGSNPTMGVGHSGKVRRRQRGHISPLIETSDVPAFHWLQQPKRRYGRITG